MTYALLQTSMTPPPVDALQRAFKVGGSLSAADAIFVADDAFGILARDLPENDALTIAGSLAAEGVEVDVVAERELPRLPEAQFFLSAHFSEHTVEFFDARERSEPVPWGALRLVAVGYDQRDVRLELVFGDAMARYFTTLERFHTHHSPEASGRSPTERFIHFIQSLVEHAPTAYRNRGTNTLLGGVLGDRLEELVAYPRPSALVEEMTWLLWRARRADEALSSEGI
jgi:hypothetical protein